MKRAATLGTLLAGVLALAAATPALASHAAGVQATSATLGPGGSVVVSGTVECVEGYTYLLTTTVRQRAGRDYNIASEGGFFGMQRRCQTTGPESYTTGAMFGPGPFHPGPAVVSSSVFICDSFGGFADCSSATDTRELRITA
jgi:hypothetical protein